MGQGAERRPDDSRAASRRQAGIGFGIGFDTSGADGG
jgi:hypothetical protein